MLTAQTGPDDDDDKPPLPPYKTVRGGAYHVERRALDAMRSGRDSTRAFLGSPDVPPPTPTALQRTGTILGKVIGATIVSAASAPVVIVAGKLAWHSIVWAWRF